MTPLRDWLATADLPPLNGPDAHAETLVALAHRCVDWDVWGGARTVRYWDALTDRVRAACYAGPTLADWWERLTRTMSLGPPANAEDRHLLAATLACEEDVRVLAALRTHGETLCLRVRVAVDVARTDYQARNPKIDQTEAML